MTLKQTTPRPTRKADWPRAGDRCIAVASGWTGTVVKRDDRYTIPTVRVKWDMQYGGHESRMTITHFRRTP